MSLKSVTYELGAGRKPRFTPSSHDRPASCAGEGGAHPCDCERAFQEFCILTAGAVAPPDEVQRRGWKHDCGSGQRKVHEGCSYQSRIFELYSIAVRWRISLSRAAPSMFR